MFTKSTQYSAVNTVSLTISTNFICDNKFNAERLSFRMLVLWQRSIVFIGLVVLWLRIGLIWLFMNKNN